MSCGLQPMAGGATTGCGEQYGDPTPSNRAISARRGAISACYWAAARNRTSTRTARTSGGAAIPAIVSGLASTSHC